MVVGTGEGSVVDVLVTVGVAFATDGPELQPATTQDAKITAQINRRQLLIARNRE
jgi:hypothetical protein